MKRLAMHTCLTCFKHEMGHTEVDAAHLTFSTETDVCVVFVPVCVKLRIIGTQLLEMCILSLSARLF